MQKSALKGFVMSISIPNLNVELVDSIAEGSLFSKSRDKSLKDTKSFSTNFLIKLFYKLKELKLTQLDNLKLFADSIKPLIKLESAKIEDSGYLTFINTEKDEE
jgi:hypothetical protein